MNLKRLATPVTIVLVIIIAAAAFAALPRSISYQGYVKDSNGIPVNSAVPMTFSLYSSNPARTNPVWQETQPAVTVDNGIYSTQLGSVTPITAPFDVPYWLGMNVNGTDMPLQPLSSTGYAFRAGVADSVPANSVGTSTIADGSITTSKIAAGSITDSLITGTISAAKLDLAGVQMKYAKTAVVAQSGGDYTSPVTAMDSIGSWCGVPSATNPCLVKIMPGVYDLGSGSLVMQPYVDIEGSGELGTIITSTIPGEFTGTVQAADNAELRSLTARNTTPFDYSVFGNAIFTASGSPRISNVTAVASGGSNNCGIYNNGSSPVINLATVRAAGQNNSYGIVNVNAATPLISNTTTSAMGPGGSNYGIHNNAAAPRLINVTATASGGTTNQGMNSGGAPGTYTIIADRSTFEGSTNCIYNSHPGFTIQLGGCKLIGPLGLLGTFNQFASYTDTAQLGSVTNGTQTFQTGGDGFKGVIVKGNSGTQSANLQEWQNGTGTAVASVSPSGVISGIGSGLLNVNAERFGGKTLAEVSATIPADMKPLLTTVSGTGSGTVTSAPTGVSCTGTCLNLFSAGTVVTLTATPSGTSTFAGWSGGVCTGTEPCTVTMDAAKNVTAAFSANNQTLTVSRTGGGTITSSQPGIYCGSACSAPFVTGSSITLTAQTDTGYSFAGWSGACTGSGNCTLSMNAAKSVSAIFTAPVTVATSGSGSGLVTSSPAGISCGASCTVAYAGGTTITLTATPDSTSTFAGWSGACSGTGTCTVSIDAAKSVAATFTRNSYLLNITRAGIGDGRITSSPSGVDCGALCSSPFTPSQVVALTATADATSIFSGWSGACSGVGSCNVVMNAAQNVTATFAQKTFGLSVTRTGPGTVTSSTGGTYCGMACSESIVAGTTVVLTASPDTGATLGTWTGCDSISGATCTTTVNAAKNITVTFNPGLSVAKSGTGSGTVTSNIGSINCGASCAATYSSGASVTLTASPATGSIFAGWMGACSGSGTCSVTMDATKSATALFMLNPQTLIVNVSGGGSVSSSPAGISCQSGTCAANFALGSTVTLTADDGGISQFSGWSGACTDTASTCDVTMDTLKSVSALFSPL